jgi:peptide/nickel transport system substrate-binding protein
MSTANRYWERTISHRLRRRALLRVAVTSGAGVAALSLIGCGDGSQTGGKVADKSGLLVTPAETSNAVAGGVLKDFQNSDFLHLDPYTSSVNNMRIHGALAYPRFTKYVPAKYPKLADSSVEGDLMESWEYSADKLQLTFKLRPGVKWDAQPRHRFSGRRLELEEIRGGQHLCCPVPRL